MKVHTTKQLNFSPNIIKMNKIVLFSFFVGLLTTGCSLLGDIPKPDPIKGAGAITLKFIQINDVYEIAPLNNGEYGGLARVAHIRDSIKQQYPNTFLFLAGDFLTPSLLGTLKVDGERLNGKQMIDVLNAMDVDLVTFGNHEFDLSEEDLQKRLNESNFKWTSANVRHATEDKVEPFTTKYEYTAVPISDYSTFDAVDPDGNKIKFAVFGVTGPYNPKEYVSYGDIYQNAVRAYDEAVKKADIVVGLTHVSIDEDVEIAKRLRSLPLIMGGHEHYNILEKEGRTIIAKADANAKSIWVHTLTYNIRTKYLFLNSDLIEIDERTPSEAKVDRVVSKWTTLLDDKLKETVDNPNAVIYSPKTPINGTDSANRSMQTNLGEIITNSMANAYRGVDAALVNGGSIRVDEMISRPLTSQDIFRILPFGGSVLKVKLRGSLLKEVLDYGLKMKSNGAYLQRYNFSQGANNEWLIKGSTISDRKIYTVAFSDFLLKGLDIPFLTPDNKDIVNIYTPKESETAADIRKAIIDYLKALK